MPRCFDVSSTLFFSLSPTLTISSWALRFASQSPLGFMCLSHFSMFSVHFLFLRVSSTSLVASFAFSLSLSHPYYHHQHLKWLFFLFGGHTQQRQPTKKIFKCHLHRIYSYFNKFMFRLRESWKEGGRKGEEKNEKKTFFVVEWEKIFFNGKT